MTAPSGAWLLLDRDSRPPVALPVPRQACLGLARAVLFQGAGWQHGGVAAGAAWQAAWEQAGLGMIAKAIFSGDGPLAGTWEPTAADLELINASL